MEQKKVSKYLFYAISEIMLVVIGIYIAIQFNNWNEGRKQKIEEEKLKNAPRGKLIAYLFEGKEPVIDGYVPPSK